MKRKKYSPEQIVTILGEVEKATQTGETIAEVTRRIGIHEQTYYRWKRQYGSMGKEEVKRLKELEKENARLKKLLADATLANDVLKEVIEGKY